MPKINTNQQAFDHIVKHLFAQGKPAVNENGTCMYRAPDGCKCAVGALIEDACYDQDIECEPVSYDSVQQRLERSGVTLGPQRVNVRLLRDLQIIHDECVGHHPHPWDNPRTMHVAIRAVALNYSLDTTVLDEAYKNADWSHLSEPAAEAA